MASSGALELAYRRIRKSYSELMKDSGAYLVLKLETKEPIEVGNFVAAFTSITNQYQKFMRATHPDIGDGAEVYVKEVKEGSIIAHLIPLATIGGLGLAVLQGMDHALVIEEFVTRWGHRLGAYFHLGGRDQEATSTDLRDFHGAVAAIANDPNGSGTIEAAYFHDEKKQIKAAIHFNTDQARTAEREIENHRRELAGTSSADHERVLMVFSRTDIKSAQLGKKSGERVIIEAISQKDYPLIYASDLAEERIKHEIREADENVYKKGFVVDVDVETRSAKPVAYRVIHVHQVIDLAAED